MNYLRARLRRAVRDRLLLFEVKRFSTRLFDSLLLVSKDPLFPAYALARLKEMEEDYYDAERPA